MTYQIEPKTMCAEGWKLRLVYLDNPDQLARVFARMMLENHVYGCEQCYEYYQELNAAAQNAEHPEVEE